MSIGYTKASWPPGGSDMAEVVRARDWTTTPLGDPAHWTAGLRTAVTTVLDSPLPTIVLWGPALIQIYNDAYRQILGDRHPVAMGQMTSECWPEVWQFNDPIYQNVWRTGSCAHFEDQPFVIAPNGVSETRYFTVTYAPARDEAGIVCGILVVAMETTRRVLAEKENIALLAAARNGNIRLQQMFHQAPSFMALLNGPEHRFEIANAAYLCLLPQRDVIGKTVQEAIPEAEDQGFIALLDQAYRSGEPFVGTAVPITLQGSDTPDLRYLNFIYQPVKDEVGRTVGIFVDGNDVTEQHQVQSELAQLNLTLAEKIARLESTDKRQTFLLELNRILSSSAPSDQIIAAACALLGNQLAVSRVLFCEVDDPTDSFVIRLDWTTAGVDSVGPEVRHLSDFGPEIIASLRRGETFACDDVRTDPRTAQHQKAYENIAIRSSLAIPMVRGGELINILNLHHTIPYHWTDEDIALARDMAERTWSAAETARAQAALRTQRDNTQDIFDNMSEGFGLIDADWRVRQMNAEGLRLGQRRAEQVIGKIHWDVWPETYGTEVETVYRRVRQSGQAEIFETCVPFLQPGPVWLEVRVYPSAGGGLAVFYHAITERKNVEKKLEEAARNKDEFLAMLAHELRNPLAPIGAAAKLLAIAPVDASRLQQISEVIGRQVGHMTSLIADLLDVSRVTQGLVKLTMSDLDCKNVVLEAVEQIRPLLEAGRHHFAVHLANETTHVSGDQKRLVQVVANLLGNAAKYTPEGGQIALRMEVDQQHVIIRVIDNGIGMSDAMIERAFELFSQAERTSDRAQGGLGIGLALVKSLVELHGGSVTAKSTPGDTGSTFTVILPRRHLPISAMGRSDALLNATSRGLQILVVDDNVDAATMLAMLLEGLGHRAVVETLPSGALKRVLQMTFDVCLIDIGLPEMDGHALARRLRALPGMAHIDLIAITGYGRNADRDAALDAGFNHHLIKPVDIRMLTDLLATIRPH